MELIDLADSDEEETQKKRVEEEEEEAGGSSVVSVDNGPVRALGSEVVDSDEDGDVQIIDIVRPHGGRTAARRETGVEETEGLEWTDRLNSMSDRSRADFLSKYGIVERQPVGAVGTEKKKGEEKKQGEEGKGDEEEEGECSVSLHEDSEEEEEDFPDAGKYYTDTPPSSPRDEAGDLRGGATAVAK